MENLWTFSPQTVRPIAPRAKASAEPPSSRGTGRQIAISEGEGGLPQRHPLLPDLRLLRRRG